MEKVKGKKTGLRENGEGFGKDRIKIKWRRLRER